MGVTHHGAKKLLDDLLGGVAHGAPASWRVVLFTVAPTNSGGGTEASYTGYARVAVTRNQTNWPAASGGDPATIANGVAVTFPGVGSGPQTIVAVGLMDAASGGNLWAWTMLDEPWVLNAGDGAPSFAPGELTFQMWGV